MSHIAVRLVATQAEMTMHGHAGKTQSAKHRQQRHRISAAAEPHHYRPVSVGQQSFCRDETGNLTLQIQFYDIIS